MLPLLNPSDWDRKYVIAGYEVTANILEITATPSGATVVTVRTGCLAPNGEVHYQTNNTTLLDPSGGVQLDKFMHQCAVWLQKLLWDKPQIKFYMVELLKNSGGHINLPCTINVSQTSTTISPVFLELAGARQVGVFRPVENPLLAIPMYNVQLRFGTRIFDAKVAGLETTVACIIGGDLVQQATDGDLDCLYQVFLPDIVRALGTAAHSKRRTVLVLGSYSAAGQEPLAQIRFTLEEHGLVGVKLDDFADIHQQSLFEKMLMFGSLARFIICDESVASGHLIELKACSDIGFVTAVLRPQGKPSTWMNYDIASDRTYMKIFNYQSEKQLPETVRDALRWAENKIVERADYYNREYPWRNPNIQLG